MPLQPLARPHARMSMQPGVCTQRCTSSVQALHRQLAQSSDPAHIRQPSSKESPALLGLQLAPATAGCVEFDWASIRSMGALLVLSVLVLGGAAAVSSASASAAGARASASGAGDTGVVAAVLAPPPAEPSDGESPEPQAAAIELATSRSSCAPSWRGETSSSGRAWGCSAPEWGSA